MRAKGLWFVVLVVCGCGAAQKEPEPAPEAKAGADAQRLFEEGKQAYAKGDLETAIARWEAGYAAKPSAAFQFNLGQAQLKAGRPEKAGENLRKYLELDPKASNKADVEKVLLEIEAAKARDESQRLFDEGNQLFREEKTDQAIAAWEAGYAKAPAPPFLYNIGMAHKAAGRKAEAATYLKRYLEAAPNSPRKAEVEKEIKQLEAKPRK